MVGWLHRQEKWAKPLGIVLGAIYVLYQVTMAADASATSYIGRRFVTRAELAEMDQKVDTLYNLLVKKECPDGNARP